MLKIGSETMLDLLYSQTGQTRAWHRIAKNMASQEIWEHRIARKKSHDGMENRNGIAIAKTCDVNCDAMPCNLQILKFITYGN